MHKCILICFSSFILASCSSIPAVPKGQSLSSYLDSVDFSGSVLVSRDGKVIHTAGYGFSNIDKKVPNTPDTQFYIASLTKQFTAMAIMQLQEQGFLSIQDPIDKFLPDFPNGSLITIEQLLNHSSGLHDFTDEWEEIKISNKSVQGVIDMFKNKPLQFEPGSKVSYSSSGYILAGLIIENVSGMSYYDYVTSSIFKPLKMIHSGYWNDDKTLRTKAIGYKNEVPQHSINISLTYAAGSLLSSVSDFYLWDQSFYNRTLVNSKSLDAMFPSDREALGVGFGTGKFKVVMGLGWGIYETDFGVEYSHVGNIDGFSTVVSRYPDERAMIVIFSNDDQFDVFTLKKRVASIALGNK